MTERPFKLPHEYTPEEAEEESDTLIRLAIAERLSEMERNLKRASANYSNRDRLLGLLKEFRSLQ